MAKPLTRSEWRDLPFAARRSNCPICKFKERMEATIENGGFAEEKPTWEHVLAHYQADHRGELPDLHKLLAEAVEVGLNPVLSSFKHGWFFHFAGFGETAYTLKYLFEVRDVLALEIYAHDKKVNVDHLIDEIAKPA